MQRCAASGENSIVIVGGANEAPWHLSSSEENVLTRFPECIDAGA